MKKSAPERVCIRTVVLNIQARSITQNRAINANNATTHEYRCHTRGPENQTVISGSEMLTLQDENLDAKVQLSRQGALAGLCGRSRPRITRPGTERLNEDYYPTIAQEKMLKKKHERFPRI